MIPKKLIISRTDSIGDVMLTLPMLGLIKRKYPSCEVLFLGRAYTSDVVACSTHVDEFLDWDVISKLPVKEQVIFFKNTGADTFIHVFPNSKLARIIKEANIPHRIGTSHRLFHFLTCNHRVNFTRKRSNLHESQLNFKLLSPLDIDPAVSIEKVQVLDGFTLIPALEKQFLFYLDGPKSRIVLHPKSKGSAVEWGIDNFVELASILKEKGHKVYITGTEEEGKMVRSAFTFDESIIDLTGKLTLRQLIAFLSNVDALVAASTGPLHLASALGIKAIGIYSSRRPIHPGRWSPIGPKSKALVKDPDCKLCKKGKKCDCATAISSSTVYKTIFPGSDD